MATLADLVKIHSHRAELLIGYLRHTEEALAGNPLLQRFGRSLDALRVPLRVVPHEPVRDFEELRAREHCRFQGRLEEERYREEQDSTGKRIYAFRGAGISDEEEKRKEIQPESLAELEPKLQIAVILGDPGSGKTEWLKHLTRTAASDLRQRIENFEIAIDDCCLPLFVHLSLVAHAFQDRDAINEIRHCCLKEPRVLTEAEQAVAAILAALIAHYRLPHTLVPWVWDRFWRKTDPVRSPPLLLCLDAWDEVRTGHDRLAPALHALASITGARIFMTSRIIGYSHQPLPTDFKPEGPRRELRICPFEWAETEKFVQGFFQGEEEDKGRAMLQELRDKHAVAGMAQNPLLVTLLCLAYVPDRHKAPLSFPLRRVDVYERVLDGLLGIWVRDDEARGRTPASPALVVAKRRLLSALARHFFPDELLSPEAIDEWWLGDGAYLKKLDPDDPLRVWLKEHDGKLADALCRDAVLVPCGDGYAFIHLTFQEYLVAYELAHRAQALAKQKGPQNWKAIAVLVDKKVWLPEWEEVVVLLAGLLKDPSPLLEILADPEPTETNPTGDDYFRHRLALAGRCLVEIPERIRQRHAALIDGLSTAVFEIWWKYRDRMAYEIARTQNPARALNRSVGGLMQIDARWGDKTCSGHLATLIENYGSSQYQDENGRADFYKANAAKNAIVDFLVTPASRAVITVLLKRLELHKGNQIFYRDLIRNLAGLGLAAATSAFFEFLVERLAHSDREVRRASAEALRGFGPVAATPEVLAALVERLADSDRHVREASAEALGGFGSVAATPVVLAALLERLADSDRGVWWASAFALGKFGSVAATPVVLAALVDYIERSGDNDASECLHKILGRRLRLFTEEPDCRAISVHDLAKR
ncbi:MAG: NACHT domain-containing protein [Methylococcales bacterium]